MDWGREVAQVTTDRLQGQGKEEGRKEVQGRTKGEVEEERGREKKNGGSRREEAQITTNIGSDSCVCSAATIIPHSSPPPSRSFPSPSLSLAYLIPEVGHYPLNLATGMGSGEVM